MVLTDPGDLPGLVSRARNGDQKAQSALIVLYQERVAGFIYAQTGDLEAVDDIAQTIFLKVVLKLRQLRQVEQFESWLFRLAHNACADHLRRQKWKRILVPFASEHRELPAPTKEPERDLEAFRKALQTLPPAQRELIILLQEREWSYEELARITKSSVSSVKSRLFRARSELKRILGHE